MTKALKRRERLADFVDECRRKSREPTIPREQQLTYQLFAELIEAMEGAP